MELVYLLVTVVKAAVVMGAILNIAAFTIWIERKGSALIQDRVGANRAAIFGFDLAGVLNTLIADPVKALMKEDFVPKGTSQFVHSMGPFMAVFPILVSLAVVPFGPPLTIEGVEYPLQLANLNVGVLYVFAMGSLAVYGVVIAGWVSNNKFSLFGGLRASAQMISYEVTMGLSILGLLAIYGSLQLNDIVDAQGKGFNPWGILPFSLPAWGILLNPVAFLVFFTSMMAETKRAPFDLPEAESELVAGYFTEYSGMKFLLYWLGEFAEVGVCSTMVVVLFFGGWQLPFVDIRAIPGDLWGVIPGDWWLARQSILPTLLGAGIFGAKVALFCIIQVVIRWTLPRFRYDQLMTLCWKILLPISLLNLVITAALLLSGFYHS